MLAGKRLKQRHHKVDDLRHRCRPQANYELKNAYVESQLERLLVYFKGLGASEDNQFFMILR